MTTADLHAAMPLTGTLGIELAEASRERVDLRLRWAESLCTSASLLHGGALMTLADSAGGLLAALNLPEDAAGTATIESKTNLLRAVREGDEVEAMATVLHQGRSTIVVETTMSVGDRLVAKTAQTQAILR